MEVAERQAILAPGDMLGCYRIDSFLGQGGFGVTYIARDTMLDIQVVIKEYLPERIAERVSQSTVQPRNADNLIVFQRGLANFLKEARTLARFKHPNIVRVMSVFELNNTAYMVMEYERGYDLKLLFTRGQHVTEQALKAIVGPILDGLDEVHRHGFIHRDIKPANILVRNNGSPVLLDFGSARMADGQSTETLTAMVTAGFAPLEQYSGLDEQQGPWTDIYALGAVLYFAVTGNAPVDSTLRGAAILNDSDDPLVPLTVLAPEGFSPAFCRAVDWALQFKVSRRPQTSEQWRARLLSGDADGAERSVSPAAIKKDSVADLTTVDMTPGKTEAGKALPDDVTRIQPVRTGRRATDKRDDTYELRAETQWVQEPRDLRGHARPQRRKMPVWRSRTGAIAGVSLVVVLSLIGLLLSSMLSGEPATSVSPPSVGTNDQAVSANTTQIRAADSDSDSDPKVVEQNGTADPSSSQAPAATQGESVLSLPDTSVVPLLEAQQASQREADEEKRRIAAAREAQRDIDREVQRAEARRQVQLQEQVEAKAAASRASEAAAKREAQRQIKLAEEQGRQREAKREAAKRNAIKPAITNADMSTVLARFNELSTSIKQRDADSLREITLPSVRKYAYFDYVFRTFEKVEVSVRNIQASRQDQTIRANLYIQRMIRSNGDIAIPPDEFRRIPIYAVKEAQWSAIHW